MSELFAAGELSREELLNLMFFVNTIITYHRWKKGRRKVVRVMGGKVIETESEKLFRIGREESRGKDVKRVVRKSSKKGHSLVETCQKVGISITDAVKKLASKFGLSMDVSFLKVNQYWQK